MAVPYERKAILEEQGYRVNAYPNMKECLDAVHRGEADFTYDDMYLVSYYLAASNYKNVKTADATFQETQTCFGLLQPIDPNLLSVFNKGIQDVSSREMASMVYAHSFPERTITLGDLVAEHPGLFALVDEHTVRAGGRWPCAVRLHACAGGQARLAHPAVQFRSVPQARREVAWTFAALGAQPARHRTSTTSRR